MQVSKCTQPEGETSLRDVLFHQFHHRNLGMFFKAFQEHLVVCFINSMSGKTSHIKLPKSGGLLAGEAAKSLLWLWASVREMQGILSHMAIWRQVTWHFDFPTRQIWILCETSAKAWQKTAQDPPHISSKNVGVDRRSGSMHDSVFFWLGRGKLTIRYVPGRDGGELERLVEHLEAGLPLENQLNDWIPVLWLRLIPHHLASCP